MSVNEVDPLKSPVVQSLADIARALKLKLSIDRTHALDQAKIGQSASITAAYTGAGRWLDSWLYGPVIKELWAEARKKVKYSGKAMSPRTVELMFCSLVLEELEKCEKHLMNIGSDESIQRTRRLCADDRAGLLRSETRVGIDQKIHPEFFTKTRTLILKSYPGLGLCHPA